MACVRSKNWSERRPCRSMNCFRLLCAIISAVGRQTISPVNSKVSICYARASDGPGTGFGGRAHTANAVSTPRIRRGRVIFFMPGIARDHHWNGKLRPVAHYPRAKTAFHFVGELRELL